MQYNLPILDHTLALKQVSGNASLADDLLRMFIKECEHYQNTIKDYQKINNLSCDEKDQLHQVIHKMHGGLRYIGAPALLHYISQTDTQLLSMDDDNLKQSLTHIQSAISQLVQQEHYDESVCA